MHDATVATETAKSGALLMRPDTIFGVCQGIGDDLGFNPDWLRVALASMVLFNPPLAVSIYAVLGVIVLASRLMFPDRAPAAAPAAEQAAPAEAANEEQSIAVAA